MPKKYNPGDKLGKLNILFIEELPKLDKKNRRGVFQCPYCNNTFIANLNNVVYNKTKSCGCFRSNNTRKHIIQINKTKKQKLDNNRYGNCIVLKEAPEQKRGTHTYWECLCDCGEKFFARTDNLKNFITTCCPICSKSMSHGERLIKTILEQHQIQYQREACKTINGITYRFDFYLPDYNCYIEFDGEQHYKSHFYDRFKDRNSEQLLLECQQRDKIKNKYCFDNNILLIRIPYTKLSTLQLEDLLPPTSNFVIER